MGSRRSITRRDFLRLSATAAMGAMVAACAPATPEVVEVVKEVPVEKVVKETVMVEKEVVVEKPAKPAEEVTVDVWWGWGAEIHVQAIKAALQRFEELNPGIKVNGLGGAGWGEKLLTAMAAGEPPDVTEMSFSADFGLRGALLPLDDYLAASDVIKRDNFFDASWLQCEWQGKTYAVPCLEHGPQLALFANEGLVEKAGLDLGQFPGTWDEVWEWSEAMTVVDSAGNLDILGFDPLDAMGSGGGGDFHYVWAALWGIQVYDPETREFKFDDPGWVDVLNTINRWYSKYGPEKFNAFRQSSGMWTGSAECGIANGHQAMQMNGYWSPGELAHTAPDVKYRYGWPPVPASREGKKIQIVGSHNISIPSSAKHPDEAFQVIEFLTTNEALDIIFDGCGFITATKSYLNHVDVGKYRGFDFYINSLKEADEVDPALAGICPISKILGDQFLKVLEAVKFGDKTPEKALADAQTICTEELQKALTG